MVESYIVRIYRRDRKGMKLAGTVEIAGTQETKPFKNADELIKILSTSAWPPKKTKKRISVQITNPGEEGTVVPIKCQVESKLHET